MGTYRAKLFRNGGSQAVRLPKACRFPGDEVIVRQEGSRVIIEPVEQRWSREFLALVEGPRDETFPRREQPSRTDERESLEP